MLIALLIFIFCLLTVFVCGIAIGRKGRELLRLELSNLRGKHETLAQSYRDMKRIAAGALEVAKERHFPKAASNRIETESQFGTSVDLSPYIDSVARSMPNYIPPTEKHCPECSVSVRADSWPQECPACHCLFGFQEH